jgi:hypothetical protein
MKNETIDELIDRVAGDMTRVTADATVSMRARQRVGQKPRSHLMAAAGVALTLIAVVAAAAQWATRAGNSAQTAEEPLLARHVDGWTSLPQAPAQDTAVLRSSTNPARPARVADALPRRVWAFADDVDAPPALVVAELQVAPLAEPLRPDVAPLEFAPLEFAPLAVPELSSVKDAKEPR